jgi:outer membrane lipoprotein SlyB
MGEGIKPSRKAATKSQYAESLGQAASYAGTAYQGASAGDYGSAILGGAASGATLGSAILPGWGTAIGGVLGAAGGAIGTAVSDNNKEDDWQSSMLKKTADLNYKTMMQNYLKQKRNSQWETDFRNRLRFGSK